MERCREEETNYSTTLLLYGEMRCVTKALFLGLASISTSSTIDASTKESWGCAAPRKHSLPNTEGLLSRFILRQWPYKTTCSSRAGLFINALVSAVFYFHHFLCPRSFCSLFYCYLLRIILTNTLIALSRFF